MRRDALIPLVGVLATLGGLSAAAVLLTDVRLGVGLIGVGLSVTALVLLVRAQRGGER